MRKIIYFTFIVLLAAAISSCNKIDKEQELDLLYKYLETNEIDIDPTESGLYFLESGFSTLQTFASDFPSAGDSVFVIYKGYLLADPGVVFAQTSLEELGIYIFKSEDVLKGWEEGIGYMKTGTSAKIIVPSSLGYGKERTGLIPPYSTLIFEVRILDIRK